LAISVKEFEDKAGILGRDCSVLEQLVTSYNQKLSLYNELEAMGLGLRELKLLWHTIREIAEANNIPLDQAPQKFYKDIEEQYDDKLGLELKINELRSEISTVSINLNASRTALLAQPLVASSLQRLFSKGVVEQDIVEFANLLDRSYNDSAHKSTMDKQSLLTELQKYGSIKSTVQELNQQVARLRNEIAALQKQKQGLDEQS
jgi:uncharacterized small protein (DUF1192 family)